MKIAIGADHCGVELKDFLVRELSSGGAAVVDRGTTGRASCDYCDYAIAVAKDVASGMADFGVLVCKTGIGMSMSANRFQNVRAALCATTEAATLTRQHNGANVLCMSADAVSPAYALEMVRTFV